MMKEPNEACVEEMGHTKRVTPYFLSGKEKETGTARVMMSAEDSEEARVEEKAKRILELNVYNSLFEGLPAIDANIDYGEQAELLQICNLALLDEIKRIEDDNREAIFRLNFKQQDGYRSAKYETNPKEPFLMNAPHDANHK